MSEPYIIIRLTFCFLYSLQAISTTNCCGFLYRRDYNGNQSVKFATAAKLAIPTVIGTVAITTRTTKTQEQQEQQSELQTSVAAAAAGPIKRTLKQKQTHNTTIQYILGKAVKTPPRANMLAFHNEHIASEYNYRISHFFSTPFFRFGL